MNTDIICKKNTLLCYFLIALNIIVPILSVEALLPWVICIFCITKSLKALNNSNKPIPTIVTYLLLNIATITLFNFMVTKATTYLIKMLM